MRWSAAAMSLIHQLWHQFWPLICRHNNNGCWLVVSNNYWSLIGPEQRATSSSTDDWLILYVMQFEKCIKQVQRCTIYAINCYGRLLLWHLYHNEWQLDCNDNLTAITSWLQWQLDCYDSLIAMTAWLLCMTAWLPWQLFIFKILSFETMNVLILAYDIRLTK